MESFTREIQIRWSDLDPNAHLRHSVYYDWGALSRVEFLYQHGLTSSLMQQLHFGPILFREECVFKKEIHPGDKISIGLKLLKAKKDFSRWSIQHDIVKNGDILSAIIIVDGAWIDTVRRKLATPPGKAAEVFHEMPKGTDFHWLD